MEKIFAKNFRKLYKLRCIHIFMNPLEYYATQSSITHPGKYIGFFADLPYNVSDLCRIVQGLIMPTDGEELFNYTIPKKRLQEADTRYVEDMLAKIIALDDRSLTKPRPPEKRFVGCCRDFAVLFCAMARHQGIPTRTRVGFATYIAEFGPDYNGEHEIAEYWDSSEKRWRLVDPEQSDVIIRLNNIHFDTTDIPRDKYLVAGEAWQMCRAGEADPEKFGGDPGDTFLKGWWFIRSRLVHDLARQNKMELLLWDVWGLTEYEIRPTEDDLALLDRLAKLTQAGNDVFDEMQTIYEQEASLKVPSVVTCYSPWAEPTEVVLAISD